MKINKIKLIATYITIVCCLNTSYATVGIPNPNSSIENETENSNLDTENESEIESDSENNGDIEYNPLDSQPEGTHDETEENTKNKQLLDKLQESWDEDPGGSTYTEEAAYYKIGNLTEKPELNAPSSILIDASSGVVLYNKGASEKKFPASMTKVMTALVAIENGNLEDEIEYSENAVNGIPKDATKAGFAVGDKTTLKESLYALFMSSAADSAIAIAEHIGGDVDSFVEMMNTKAQMLGCANTNFVNPHGMHDANHYTTAHDMALIMQCAISYPDFCEIIEEKTYTIPASDKVKKEITLTNRSALLSQGNANYYEFAKGSKTGHTDAAKYTLVSYAEKDKERLICVVMDEENFDNCYLDSKRLFEWGYNKTQALFPMPDESEIDGILSTSLTDEKYEKIHLLSLKYIPEYSIITNKAINKDAVKCFFVLDENMENGVLGYLNVSYYDKVLIGKTPILYDTETEGYKEYLRYYDGSKEETPIIVTPSDESNESDSTAQTEEGLLDITNDQKIPDELLNTNINKYIIQGMIIYGMIMIILCMVAEVIITIRRKRGY